MLKVNNKDTRTTLQLTFEQVNAGWEEEFKTKIILDFQVEQISFFIDFWISNQIPCMQSLYYFRTKLNTGRKLELETKYNKKYDDVKKSDSAIAMTIYVLNQYPVFSIFGAFCL